MKQKIIILVAAVAALVAGFVFYLYFSVDREPRFEVGTSQNGKWQRASGYFYNHTNSILKVKIYEEVEVKAWDFGPTNFHFFNHTFATSSFTLPVKPGEVVYTESKTKKKYSEFNSAWLGRYYGWVDDYTTITNHAVREEKLPDISISQ